MLITMMDALKIVYNVFKSSMISIMVITVYDTKLYINVTIYKYLYMYLNMISYVTFRTEKI